MIQNIWMKYYYSPIYMIKKNIIVLQNHKFFFSLEYHLVNPRKIWQSTLFVEEPRTYLKME